MATPESLPSGAVTFLMTDVEGSTRRWEAQPEAMRAAMAAHDTIVQETVALHRGLLLKERGEGDSHFAVFPVATDALNCAIDLQNELNKDGGLRIRIALHTGEAEIRNSDYYGPAVNRCARIRAAGHGGQILISQATQRLVKASLSERAELTDLGRHRLKDLLHPERLFQVTSSGFQKEFPPLRTLDEVRHNLPLQLSSFVGRLREIEEIKGHLLYKRLVTLTGAGGNGKTRLSLQVGAELVERYPDGIWFVPLASVVDESLIPQAVVAELRLGAADDPQATLENHFETWNALLILDNCEQIVKGAAGLARRLLEACPGLSILATSREALGIAGEQIYKTPTLAYSLGSTPPTVEALAELDGPRLLVERARDRGYSALLTHSQAPAIAKLCKRLDGIPLAIEQAAANLDIHTPEQLLAKLDQHFAMRGLEEEGVEERHRTVEATIDWSYQMLSPEERLMFGRLAVFVNGWSLEAARAVCSGDGLTETEADGLLAKLLRKSLVFVEQAPWDERRFRLLEVVRQFALEKTPVDEPLKRRHHAYYFGLAQESLNQLIGPQQAHWAQLLEAEHDNLRRALAWAQQHGCSLEMAVALRRFWLRIGFVREGLSALRFAVENEKVSDPELEGHAFNSLGAFAYKIEDLKSAQGYYEESLLRWQRAGRDDLEAAVLHNLALVAIQRGHVDTALDHLQTSLEMSEAQGHAPQAAGTLLSMGGLQLQFGGYLAAERYLSDASARFRKLGDAYNEAVALGRLADAHFRLGSTRLAAQDFLSALEIWESVHDPYALGTALLCLAEIALDGNQIPSAAFFFECSNSLLLQAEAQLDEYLSKRRERLLSQLETLVSNQEFEKIKSDAEFASLDHLIQRARDFCSMLAIGEHLR